MRCRLSNEDRTRDLAVRERSRGAERREEPGVACLIPRSKERQRGKRSTHKFTSSILARGLGSNMSLEHGDFLNTYLFPFASLQQQQCSSAISESAPPESSNGRRSSVFRGSGVACGSMRMPIAKSHGVCRTMPAARQQGTPELMNIRFSGV